MKRRTGSLIVLVLFLLFTFIAIISKRVHYKKTVAELEKSETVFSRDELLARRAYLIDALENRKYAVSEMPLVGIPFQHEWALVSSSMTAIALTNLAFRYPETRESALDAVEDLVIHVLSSEYRELGFHMWGIDPLKNLTYAPAQAWYAAHAGYVLSAYKYLGGDNSYDEIYNALHKATYRTIDLNGPYIETYPDQTYTADNVILYAALKLYNNLNGSENSHYIEDWLFYTKTEMLDPRTNIIKSYVTDFESPYVESRGSWTGWNSFFLPVVDSAFAKEQYDLAKEHFFDSKWEFTMFREFPKGVKAKGDIDSGPVIFGGSPSGTGFIIGGTVWQKDYEKLYELLHTAEFVGTSVGTDKRHYLAAPLVGDAIMLAMLTATPWDMRFISQES